MCAARLDRARSHCSFQVNSHSMELPLPARIETARLLLRPWEVADAQRLKDAIDANLEHLRAWMPWAMTEPSALETVALRIETFRQNFATGAEWVFAIFSRDESRVIGGIGLHPRIGVGAVEIGYWAQMHETRQGYITEAAEALTAVAFASPDVERVQIRCDPANVAARQYLGGSDTHTSPPWLQTRSRRLGYPGTLWCGRCHAWPSLSATTDRSALSA